MYQRRVERSKLLWKRAPGQESERLDRAFRAVETVTAVGALLGGLELLRVRKTYTDGSLNSWPITRTRLFRLTPPRGRVIDAAVRYPHVLAVAGARAVSGAALLVPNISRAARGIALVGAVGSGALLHLRTNYGNDGSDHLSTISLTASMIEKAFPHDTASRRALLGFIAAQSALSYVTSGATKLRSAIWRSGEALTGVTRTRTYGDEWLYRLLRDRPRATMLASWGIMLFEVAFPLVFVLPGPLSRALLGGAAFFHLLNARFMGLNRFLWAFVGSYPAVVHFANVVGARIDAGFSRSPVHRAAVSARRIVVSFSLVAAALAFVGAVHLYARRPREIPRGPGATLILPDAGVHVVIHARPRRPLVLFESALATPCSAWAHVTAALDPDFSTVCYDRAGNGWSARGPAIDAEASSRRSIAVMDAIDEEEAILVGHSVGGLLALVTAALEPRRVRGLVLVDSSHPDQLERSSAQRDGRPLVAQGLHSMLTKTHWGRTIPPSDFGAVLELPTEVRDRTLALLNTPHPWRGALDELAAWERGWTDAARRVKLRHDLPVAVVTAGEQARIDPVHLELQIELSAMTSCSRRAVVDNVTHDELVLSTEPAAAVAAAIRWVHAQSVAQERQPR